MLEIISKSEAKADLRSNIGSMTRSGTYSIEVNKAAVTKAMFTESINGIRHHHNWFNLIEAHNYLGYKIKLNKYLSDKRQEYDASRATVEYRSQLSSFENIKTLITVHLNDEISYSNTNQFTIDFTHSKEICIEWQNGDKIAIVLIGDSYIVRPTKISDNPLVHEEFHAYATLGDLVKHVFSDDTKRHQDYLELNALFYRYKEAKTNLDKFTEQFSSSIKFPYENDVIIDFMKTAKDGDIFRIALTDFDSRKRFLEVERKSRIKYIIEVRNYREENNSTIMQAEYWLNITKFSSDYTGNIERIKKIYEALY